MEERSFDLYEILDMFKQRRNQIIIVIGVITLLGGIYASTLDTMYRARIKVYVGDSENIITMHSTEEMKYYQNFTNTFKEIIVIDDFLNETLEKNEINLTADQVRSHLSFSSSASSPILEINYTGTTEKQARDVLEALSAEYETQAKTILSQAKVQIVDSIKIFAIKPETISIILVAFVSSVLLAIGGVFTLDYLDDTIRRKETLERLLDIPVLGQIPQDRMKGDES